LAPVLEATEAFAQTERSGDEKADIVFHNGPVYTVNGPRAWARAVAVRGNHIAYVGADAGAQSWIGPGTRVVDLRGKMLLAGFVEGHIHPIVGAPITRGVDLQYDTREETLSALESYRSQLGMVDVVRGFGWRYNAFPATGPRKEDLDQIWPDIPVFLIAIDGHSAWVNSEALQIAGVRRDTKDPLPGFSYFQRDAMSGEPTGWLIEPPAMASVMQAVAPSRPTA